MIIKLYPGKTEEQKTALAGQITRAVMETLLSKEDAVSVSFEEVQPQDWAQLTGAEIVGKPEQLYSDRDIRCEPGRG
ncbi:MAG: tautomerase family protein [Chthoniobacteraceae bacterium]